MSCMELPETGKLSGQGFVEGIALTQALRMRTMNGGKKTRSAWIPGVESLTSLMRLTADFSPQVNHPLNHASS